MLNFPVTLLLWHTVCWPINITVWFFFYSDIPRPRSRIPINQNQNINLVQRGFTEQAAFENGSPALDVGLLYLAHLTQSRQSFLLLLISFVIKRHVACCRTAWHSVANTSVEEFGVRGTRRKKQRLSVSEINEREKAGKVIHKQRTWKQQ